MFEFVLNVNVVVTLSDSLDMIDTVALEEHKQSGQIPVKFGTWRSTQTRTQRDRQWEILLEELVFRK